jgi:quercetin dioxygenase-like cupin family protein
MFSTPEFHLLGLSLKEENARELTRGDFHWTITMPGSACATRHGDGIKEEPTLATKTSWEKIESEPMLAGLNRQMINGEKLSLARMRFEPGTKVPRHQHANEQITIVTAGRMLLIMDDREIELGKGEMILIPGSVPHGAVALEETESLEIFAPRREDWIAKDDSYLRGSK